MLKLTQFAGFGGPGGGTDTSVDPLTFSDVADAGFVASATSNTVTVTGIDTTVTLRLTLSAAMSALRTVTAFRDGLPAVTGSAGSAIEVAMRNGQTLAFGFTNAQDLSTWAGTASLTNLSDNGAAVGSFSFSLADTGFEPGGGGGEIP